MLRRRALIMAGATLLPLIAACGQQDPAPPPVPPPPAAPAVTLPADMPPLTCADLEPPPVKDPQVKLVGRRCTDPDGATRWIAGFYPCTEGRVWVILTKDRPVSAPPEPAGPAFDQCLGR